MNTLLMRLVAPLQSWGVESHYTVRDSGLEPSKSGVIGLICAAMGRPRQAALDDLNSLRMGVRVDREGTLRNDFHIAQKVLLADGKGVKNSVTSNRYYLSDAAFLVGLEGADLNLLASIQQALQQPVWAIFLGRKAFVPAASVWLQDGLRSGVSLETALQDYGWIYAWAAGKAPSEIRMVIEDTNGEQSRPDVPVSFAERRFSSRRVKTGLWTGPATFIREVTDESIQTDA
jgi:CRISPR system Cascade subunit CasD